MLQERYMRVLLPTNDEMAVRPPPATLETLLAVLATRMNVDSSDIKLTFRDSAGERMMLVGETRYQEALASLQERVLQVTVVLVPKNAKPRRHRRLSRSHSIASTLFGTSPSRIPVESAEKPTESTELKTRVSAIINNSMRLLSEKFKELLYRLSTTDAESVDEIDLSGSAIGAYECILLAELLEFLPKVRAINLEGNCITSSGLQTLCGSLRFLPHLHFLNLCRNEISSKGLKFLADTIRKLPELEVVSIAHNGLGREDVDMLMDAAPALCRVHHDLKTTCLVM